MLDLALTTLGAVADRVALVEGYVDDAPAGPFDAAVCLLTLHFLDRKERVRTLAEMRSRLKPGAPLVTAHSSFPQAEPARSRWIARYAAYALASDADPAMVEAAMAGVSLQLPALTPQQDEDCLADAGFGNVEQFYAAFTWRGWVATA